METDVGYIVRAEIKTGIVVVEVTESISFAPADNGLVILDVVAQHIIAAVFINFAAEQIDSTPVAAVDGADLLLSKFGFIKHDYRIFICSRILPHIVEVFSGVENFGCDNNVGNVSRKVSFDAENFFAGAQVVFIEDKRSTRNRKVYGRRNYSVN